MAYKVIDDGDSYRVAGATWMDTCGDAEHAYVPWLALVGEWSRDELSAYADIPDNCPIDPFDEDAEELYHALQEAFLEITDGNVYEEIGWFAEAAEAETAVRDYCSLN